MQNNGASSLARGKQSTIGRTERRSWEVSIQPIVAAATYSAGSVRWICIEIRQHDRRHYVLVSIRLYLEDRANVH